MKNKNKRLAFKKYDVILMLFTKLLPYWSPSHSKLSPQKKFCCMYHFCPIYNLLYVQNYYSTWHLRLVKCSNFIFFVMNTHHDKQWIFLKWYFSSSSLSLLSQCYSVVQSFSSSPECFHSHLGFFLLKYLQKQYNLTII